MTRDEIRDVLRMLTECYPNAKKPNDPKTTLDMWEMAFGEYEATDVFMAVRYYINHGKFFPTIADIHEAIPKGKLVYEKLPPVNNKAIPAKAKIEIDYDHILDLGMAEECKNCSRRHRCFPQ